MELINVAFQTALPCPTSPVPIPLEPSLIGRGRAHARQHLALDPGGTSPPLKGLPTTDPVFGLPAFWIAEALVLKAQTSGYTVVDVPTVVTTHLVELVQSVAHELYDAAQLGRALERVAVDNPRLVEDLVPDPLPRVAVLRVFRNLLREGISVRDTQTILEALSDAGVKVGLSRRNAQKLAAQTVMGSAKMLLETDEHVGHLKDMVTSPGGTAIAGLHTLEEGGLRTTLINAVETATKRARELGRGGK